MFRCECNSHVISEIAFLSLGSRFVTKFNFCYKNIVIDYKIAIEIFEKCIENYQELIFESFERVLFCEYNQILFFYCVLDKWRHLCSA